MEGFLDTCGQRRVKSLLLVYLCVVKAAADCPIPQRQGNLVLTNDALLMNDFPENVEVTLECTIGHVRESGSGIITCIDDKWTEPDLICKKKDCGPPKPQPNMSFNTSGGTLFGAVITVICDKGYQIGGSSHKQCFAAGWNGRSQCDIVTCEKPANITNGRSSWDSQDDPKYGEIIQYTCDEGYTLTGNDNIVCTETRQYNSQPPECKGVTTEDRVTTKMATSTSPAQDASTPSPATPTAAHRDQTVTPPPVSPSVRGGKDIFTAEDKATTASVTSTTSSSLQDKQDEATDTNEDIGYTPVIISVVGVSLALCIVVLFLHKFLLRRKGSGTAPLC